MHRKALGADRTQRPLHLELMLRFQTPRPGVRVGEIQVRGYSTDEIRSCFLRLRANGIIRVMSCSDSTGTRYRGHLVGLSRLGVALLSCQFMETQLNSSRLGALGEDSDLGNAVMTTAMAEDETSI